MLGSVSPLNTNTVLFLNHLYITLTERKKGVNINRTVFRKHLYEQNETIIFLDSSFSSEISEAL